MKKLLISLALIPSILHTPDIADIPCRASTAYIERLAEEVRQQKCLAVMIYGEARGESIKGKIAVAYTAANRAIKKPVCKVVLAPKQYSIFNDNDALKSAAMSAHLEPTQKNSIDQKSWEESLSVAHAVMSKTVKDPTNGASHYLAPSLMKKLNYKYPKWSKVFKVTAVIDNHKFFKPIDKKDNKS